jgi:glycosyltransferase involved in cell wall biosynthesis
MEEQAPLFEKKIKLWISFPMSTSTLPNVSVLMSVYNGEKYIARAVLSLLAQSYADFELILIDDGSTDRTSEIISQVKDDRLNFHRQDNIGLTKTLNKALKMAKGRLIARHDADDFSIYNRFSRQVDFLESNFEVGLLGSSCFIQPEKHGIINEVYAYPERHHEIVTAFTEYNPFVHGSMMIRRDLLEKIGGYNEAYRYVQDYELWSRLLPKTQAHNLSAPLYVRSVHQQTSQASVDKDPIFHEIKANYMERSVSPGTKTNKSELRQIQSQSLYPWVTLAGGWNRSIAKTYHQMSRVSKKQGMPWSRLLAQAFVYSPVIL